MSYVPSFMKDPVIEWFSDDPTTTWQQNQIYCLVSNPADPGGVQAFVKLFPQFTAAISMDVPSGPDAVDISSSQFVPFITWTAANGKSTGPVNAGVFANCYNHGVPEKAAWTQVYNSIVAQLG